jgi:hypothetical protein
MKFDTKKGLSRHLKQRDHIYPKVELVKDEEEMLVASEYDSIPEMQDALKKGELTPTEESNFLLFMARKATQKRLWHSNHNNQA